MYCYGPARTHTRTHTHTHTHTHHTHTHTHTHTHKQESKHANKKNIIFVTPRYIYLWIYYGVFEELVAKDFARAREVYKAALATVPHKAFTFAKLWLIYAQFEIRRKDVGAARKVAGHRSLITPSYITCLPTGWWCRAHGVLPLSSAHTSLVHSPSTRVCHSPHHHGAITLVTSTTILITPITLIATNATFTVYLSSHAQGAGHCAGKVPHREDF
jgi:hypothetical protein